MIGEGIYFVVFSSTHSQVSTCVSPINTGVSITPAMKVRIWPAVQVLPSPKVFPRSNSKMRLISLSYGSQKPLLLVLLSLLPRGPFNNYVTLKLPFSDSPPTITFHHEWSQDPSYITSRLTQIPRLYHLFLFFWSWKKPKIRTHPWHIHPCF